MNGGLFFPFACWSQTATTRAGLELSRHVSYSSFDTCGSTYFVVVVRFKGKKEYRLVS